uniref:Epithelial stromal interaction 1 n=1 Tax=Scophthalmus maximus TaxID=52904 RepID=A0A8D3AIA3_SCOMX
MDPPHPPHPPPHPNSSRNTPGTGRDSETTGTDQTDTNAAVPPAADRQPQCSGGYTVIPPNEFRRSKLIRMAQEEEEARQRWKETHRVPYVQPISERLGGDVTLAEARDKQLRDQQRSRVQKKMKQDELDKTRRQEEEAELQKKKDEQRRKAERLVAREHQDQQRRRQQLEPDYLRTSDRFLQSLERRAPDPRASSAASHTSSTSEVVPSQQREKVQLDHKRVNSAFLDNLEGRGGGGSGNPPRRDGVREAGGSSAAPGGSGHRAASTASGRLTADPEQSWTQEDGCDTSEKEK